MKRRNKLKGWNRAKTNTEPTGTMNELESCPIQQLRLAAFEQEMESYPNNDPLSPSRRVCSTQHALQPWTSSDPWLVPASPTRTNTASSTPNNRRRYTGAGTKEQINRSIPLQTQPVEEQISRRFQTYNKLLAVRQRAQSNYFEFPFLSFRSGNAHQKRSLSTLASNFPLKVKLNRLPLKLSRNKFYGIERGLVI